MSGVFLTFLVWPFQRHTLVMINLWISSNMKTELLWGQKLSHTEERSARQIMVKIWVDLMKSTLAGLPDVTACQSRPTSDRMFYWLGGLDKRRCVCVFGTKCNAVIIHFPVSTTSERSDVKADRKKLYIKLVDYQASLSKWQVFWKNETRINQVGSFSALNVACHVINLTEKQTKIRIEWGKFKSYNKVIVRIAGICSPLN